MCTKKTFIISQYIVYVHNNLTSYTCYSKLKKYHIHGGLSAPLIFVSKGAVPAEESDGGDGSAGYGRLIKTMSLQLVFSENNSIIV